MAESGESVLCVGNVCLDIINYCDHYPTEDEDIRAIKQKWSKGGNGANTSCVLRMLRGENCEFLGTLGSGMETDFVLSEFDQFGVNHTHCVTHPQYRLSTSYVVLNTENGSRTIVHYRNIPELIHDDFLKIDLSKYLWIHFEGRNVLEVSKMISTVREHNISLKSTHHKITISIEIEKEKNQESLIPLADVLFVGKEYACHYGYKNAKELCLGIQGKCKDGTILICPWGEDGAVAIDSAGQLFSSPSFPPPGGLIDTLGAGDTFIAAVIHKLASGRGIQDAISFGCRVAGAKCGMDGYKGLADIRWDNPDF